MCGLKIKATPVLLLNCSQDEVAARMVLDSVLLTISSVHHQRNPERQVTILPEMIVNPADPSGVEVASRDKSYTLLLTGCVDYALLDYEYSKNTQSGYSFMTHLLWRFLRSYLRSSTEWYCWTIRPQLRCCKRDSFAL